MPDSLKAPQRFSSVSQPYAVKRRPSPLGRRAVWQARLVMLVMINLAQLWILAATVEAALAEHYHQLLPLIIASAVCWLIALTIFFWWKPISRRPPGRNSDPSGN